MGDRLNCYLCWFAVETHLHDVQCVVPSQAVVTKLHVAGDALDVFLLDNTDVEFSPNYEVADVLWGSLNDMYHGKVETETQFAMNDEVQSFPGYDVGGQVVWGLTMRMLDHVFTMLDPNWVGRAD